MATILLSAAGAALGAGFGGTVLGLSGAVIGRAVGATIGRGIDQRILGSGSDPVETGRVERFRLTGASEGTPIAQVWGRMRLAGQVIWATKFQENSTVSRGSKGAPAPATTSFSYTVSLAIALCEGVATRVGRIWADGIEIAPDSLDLRFYPGTESQIPDPKIEAVEGFGLAPAYRGIAYVVIEALDLSRFGNRVPQFSFEVLRRAQGVAAQEFLDLPTTVRAVCLIPGTGEYALATTPVHYSEAPGVNRTANVNTVAGITDFAASLDQLREELPAAGSVSLVVSWFGSDLRCGVCDVQPKVEQSALDGVGMPWRAGGIARAAAATVPLLGGLSVYGGTPADAAVIEAIQAVRAGGQEVMFYPFILMEQLAANGLSDPWTGAADQPVLPWRGRITLNAAPGQPGSTDRTAAAAAEVAGFFGATSPSDFTVNAGVIAYSGPAEWRYRRFILHYAHLCALAGGVDAFCIGSEMRGLTQIRGAGDSFPAVVALRQLAAEVRAILGAGTEITYAADWSEYFGYHVGSNVYFHLDPLWSDANIDFIGIDNYMPLSDWRDGQNHADSFWGSIYNVEYLKSNIAGAELYDWYYDGPEGELAQLRKPITDGAYGEPWVFRAKDLKGWWENAHHNRTNGVREGAATDWLPRSKPIRFTEYGCAAMDKGSNQPNKFLDPKSSESGLPRNSSGHRDDLIQLQFLRAHWEHWNNPVNNPVSVAYGGSMIDTEKSHVWAWDARPFPDFPGNGLLWGDGANFAHGHWLNGRSASQPLSGVVGDIIERSGIVSADLAAAHGIVRGYSIAQTGSGRSALQPLSVAFGMETIEREGMLTFRMRDGNSMATIDKNRLALTADMEGALEATRSAEAETVGRIRVDFVQAESSFETRSAEAIFPDESADIVSTSEMPLLLTANEAQSMAERWLAEARIGRDIVRFSLPRSDFNIGAGDVVRLDESFYRIDRVEQSELQMMDAVRVEPGVYLLGTEIDDRAFLQNRSVAPVPVFPLFMDLPLLSGDEDPIAPHIAVSASPWPGPVSVWSAASDAGYSLNLTLENRAAIGLTETVLAKAQTGVWDRGPALRVKMISGTLSSASDQDVLSGLNAAVIGDGTPENWEVLQFREAVLVAPATYEVTLRLRGQSGSDGIVPNIRPVGSYFILLDGAVDQIQVSASARGLERFYRIGPTAKGFGDQQAVAVNETFFGIGLRPYSVAHLSGQGSLGSDIAISWIRRTRIDGDNWNSVEVPLGEDVERYVVRVKNGLVIVREVETMVPVWTYTAAMQAVDGATAAFTIAACQVSMRYGNGPFKSLVLA